jgi:UDP-glucose 4-epimerase
MGKILITGSKGFIGKHLSKRFNEFDLISLDITSKDNNLIYDLCSLLEGKRPNIIFHLAAFARIQPSFLNPYTYIENNVNSTLEILEYARRTGDVVIFTSSSSVKSNPFANPYTFSKYQCEQLCKLYFELYNVKVIVARLFNVYGEGCPHEGNNALFMGKLEYAKRNNLPIEIRGTGEQRRDFTHVEDVCNGLIQLSKTDLYGQVFDIGTGVNYSINEVVDAFGVEKKYINEAQGESQITLAEVKKSFVAFGYQPTINLLTYIKLFNASL